MARELALHIFFISLMAIYEAIFLCTRPKMFLWMRFCSAVSSFIYRWKIGPPSLLWRVIYIEFLHFICDRTREIAASLNSTAAVGKGFLLQYLCMLINKSPGILCKEVTLLGLSPPPSFSFLPYDLSLIFSFGFCLFVWLGFFCLLG